MQIKIPYLNEELPLKALLDILKFEGGQSELPDSKPLMNGAVGAYALTQTGAQMFEHSFSGSVLFGLISAALLYGSTMMLAKFTGGLGGRFVKTLTALGAMGSVAALVYIALHLVFAIALPPPLPTGKLLRFLLFPIVVWTVFIFSWLYRHIKVRTIPSFVAAGVYVILVDMILSPLLK
jgi:hypothetical protein